VIGLCEGYRVKLTQYRGKSVTQVAALVKQLQERHNVPNSNTIADEDGVGGGVVDILGCKGFVNNSMPLPNPQAPYNDEGGKNKENFVNLKSQCYFKLAELINAAEIFIDCEDVDVKGLIIQELEQVKQWKMDTDGKKAIMPKDKVKEYIGRSPDWADTLMMRMWFWYAPRYIFADAEY